jgi:hypothetical protein
MEQQSRIVSLAFFTAILFGVSGCKSIQFSSQWRDREIIIDGSAEEWNGLMQHPEDSQVSIGLVNDEEYLYLCMISESRETSLGILMAGFTVLFENKAQKDRCIGVHFPLGRVSAPHPPPSERNNDKGHEFETMMKGMEGSLQALALIGPGKNDTLPMAMRIAESLGVVVSIKPSKDGCVYELKVPLNPDARFKYALGIGNDSLMNATLITDEIQRPSGHGGGMGPGGGGMGPGGGGMGPGGGGMGPGGGGMGPGGGGMGPGGGGMGPGGRVQQNMTERFKMKFSIHLAKK